eukprot:GFUD01011104.1.p1 GENE.GFUD01011104.1~~GFUD01011104.1.p1  ORF type:complete len:346 (-),score=148.64 GFUD01011104.1:183-1220(-)
MASQSGIVCSEELKTFFGSCRDGNIRMIKVSISDSTNPVLILDTHLEPVSSWEDDWDQMVPPQLDPDQPAFILYRLDEKDSSEGFLWILLSWSPDHAHTRQKMLYASTKATFKKEFGAGQIKDDYYFNLMEEITLAGYKRHLAVEAAPGPLSRQEEEMKEIKESESRVEISVDTKHNTLSALAFPFKSEALAAVSSYGAGVCDYVQLAIDTATEEVVLATSGACTTDQLAAQVPEESARYHLFRFKHTHQGDYKESDVFIYSMPGYSVPIKERMMYSSCRNAVVDVIEKTLNIPLEKKVEVDSGSELTEEYLQGELHPVISLNRPKFSKPPGPSRGNKRITKAPA